MALLSLIIEQSTVPCLITIPQFFGDHFRGRQEEKWGSFRGRDHFGVDLEIISGLGIISGSGSFRGLYRTPKRTIRSNVQEADFELERFLAKI